MKRKHAINAVAVLVVIGIVGMGVNAFAGRGYGRGSWGAQGGYGPCWGAGPEAGINPEDFQKLQEQRSRFFEETAELRQQIQQKRLALRYELAKKEVDPATAKTIQSELSALEAQMDEKRIDHVIEMKKLVPNAGDGYMGAGPGYGRGWHRGPGGGMMGFGPGGGMMGSGPGGGCWN